MLETEVLDTTQHFFNMNDTWIMKKGKTVVYYVSEKKSLTANWNSFYFQ